MHYHAEVWVPWDLESAASKFVESVLAPHKEDDDGKGWWDWYQIGGRWTGKHDPSYDPEKDPANIETCITCGGTGFRSGSICNGCGEYDGERKSLTPSKHGTGKRVKWPTSWVSFAGDIMEIKDLPKSLDCYTLLAQGHVFQKKIWDGEDFIDGGFDGLVIPKLKELDITRGHLVTVDYHS